MADRIVSNSLPFRQFRSSLLAGLVGLACAASGHAQSVVAPTTPVASTQLNDSLAEAGVTSSATSATSPLQWAGIGIRPHFHYRYLYGDGIQYGPGRESKTAVQTLAPGVLFELGSRWSLNYTATQIYYSDDAFGDRLDHSARLSGGAGYGNLSLGLSHRYSSESTPLAETADQTRRDVHNSSLSGAYSLGSRSGLNSSVNYSSRASEVAQNFNEWSFTQGFQYQLMANLKAGLAVGFGTVDVDTGTDMSYIRPQVQISWQATEKISLGLQAGRESRKFKESDLDRLNSPTYSGSIAYRPVDTTTLVVSASRQLAVSYFQDQITEGTTWSFSLNQRLLQRFTLGAVYSWRETDYLATRLGVSASRKDQSNTLSFRLGTQLIDRLSVGLTYQESDYDSNVGTFAYSSSQIGAEIGYRF